MIDEHFLARGHVEFITHQRFDQMPGQLNLSRKWRKHRRDAPTFIGIAVIIGGPDRKCRHLIEEKIQPMIIVENYDDIWAYLLKPSMYCLKSVKERLPIRLLLQPAGNGPANRRHVGCRNRADDAGHIYFPADTSADLNASMLIPVCCAPMSCTFKPKMPASLAR